MSNHRLATTAALLALLLSPAPARSATFIVNSTSDGGDAAPGNAVCDNGLGQCTLRAAIQEANALAGADAIYFNIGAGGVQTISPATALPAIATTMFIDGTTQPGFATTPIIELEGSGTPPGTSGLVFTGAGSTIRGLVINRFSSSGIYVLANTVVIAGNYVGTNVAGTAALGNFRGISLQSANSCQIGGATTSDRNVISGNADGIFASSGASGNTIQGNFIGTDATGMLAVPNAGGIDLFNASNTQIGGSTASDANVVSGNTAFGIVIQGLTATGNVVQGNRIGTQVGGSGPLGNTGQGVWVRNGAAVGMNTIGGMLPGEGNIIAFNSTGVDISGSAPSTGNSVLGNSIHSNTLLGIDLDADGVTPNDAGDADTGSNARQNFPVLSSALGTNTTIEISGSLASLPGTSYHIELFSNSTCDPSGNGEGETLLGTFDQATDAGGNLDFSESIPGSIAVGSFVTATATDPDGNTSEFAGCREVAGCPATPEGGCLAGFESARLSVSEKSPGKESLKLGWSKGPAFVGNALGNPLATDGTTYFLCIYDGANTLAQQYTVARAGDSCGTKPCWSNVGSIPPGDPGHKGYKYKDAAIAADGIAGINLRAGVAGATKASVKGKNNAAKGQTTLPTGVSAALAGSTSAVIQLIGSDASVCLSESLGTVSRNDGVSFKASK